MTDEKVREEAIAYAKHNKERIANAFADKVAILLVKKDFEKNLETIYGIDKGKEQIDHLIGEEYTREQLERCL